MNVVLPCRGEFGLKIRYHVPAVHALDGPKIVFHEPGEEALYPSAEKLVEVDRAHDDARRGTHPKGDWDYVAKLRAAAEHRWPGATVIQTKFGMREARFVPEPLATWSVPDPDVVVCPRWRNYGAGKNWGHWPWLTDALASRGLRVVAAGSADSSTEVECPRSWETLRPLDAAIDAMRRASLVVATDAGLAHLAVLCGAPLLLVTYNGRVAPGSVLDDAGNAMEPAYWPCRMDEYYHQANHTGSPILTSGAWMFRKLVRDEVLRALDKAAA